MLDIDYCDKQLQSLTTVTHVFYADYQDKPTWAELLPPNPGMSMNVVSIIIERVAAGFQHVSLMQGKKSIMHITALLKFP